MTVVALLNRLLHKQDAKLYHVFYFVFLVCFITCITVARPPQATEEIYRSTYSLIQDVEFSRPHQHGQRFIDNVYTIDDVYYYTHSFVLTLLEDVTYDGDSDNRHFFRGVHKPVGSIKVIQRRVKEEPCKWNNQIARQVYPKCHYELSDSNQMTTDFHTTGPTKSTFKYDFDFDGYVVDLPLNRSLADNKLKWMADTKFLDYATRQLEVRMAFLSGPTHMACSVSVLFDILSTGTIEYIVDIDPLYVELYSEQPIFRIFLDVIVLLCVIFIGVRYIYNLFLQRNVKDKVHYILGIWNLLELTMLILFTVGLIYWCMYLISDSRKEINWKHPNVAKISQLAEQFSGCLGIFAVAVTVAIFRFLEIFNLSPTTSFLNRTVDKAFGNLTIFMVIFGVLFFAYSYVGHLFFGHYMKEFADIPTAIQSTFQILLLVFPDVTPLADTWFSALYFYPMVILLVFVLMNMFITIVMSAYEQTQAEMAREDVIQPGRFTDQIINWVDAKFQTLRRRRRKIYVKHDSTFYDATERLITDPDDSSSPNRETEPGSSIKSSRSIEMSLKGRQGLLSLSDIKRPLSDFNSETVTSDSTVSDRYKDLEYKLERMAEQLEDIRSIISGRR